MSTKTPTPRSTLLGGHRLDLSPDEVLDDRIRGGTDRFRRSDLHDRALVQHGHPVRDLEDLGNLVAHHHRGEPEFAV
jgi:hypothetical protein